MSDPNKRRGNPAMVAGAPSLNPGGRPRSAHALSTRIRAKVDLDQLIDTAVTIATDPYAKASDRDKLAALSWLATHAYAKPATALEVSTAPAQEDDESDLDALSVDQLKALRDLEAEHEARRLAIVGTVLTLTDGTEDK